MNDKFLSKVTYDCKNCTNVFSTKEWLLYHLIKKHNYKTEESDVKTENRTARSKNTRDECVLKSEASFIIDIFDEEKEKRTDKKLGCQVCHRKYMGKDKLVSHFKMFHEQFLNSEYCRICKAQHKAKETFLEHVTQKCFSEKGSKIIVECKICGIRRVKQPGLKFNQQHAHHETYEYKCKDCGETYQTKKPINKHETCYKALRK